MWILIIPIGCSSEFSDSDVNGIILEEDLDYPLSSITGVSINPDGTLLAIGDQQSGSIQIYNTTTGKMHRIITGSSDLIDSVVLKFPVSGAPSQNRQPILRAELISEDNRPYTDEKLQTLLPNRLLVPQFTSDSQLSVLGTLNGIYTYRMENGYKGQGSYPATALLHYSLQNNTLTCHPLLPNSEGLWGQAREPFLKIDNDKFILPCIRASHHNGYDSSFTLAVVTPQGEYRDYLFPLPKEYRDSSIGYQYLTPLITQNDKGEIIAMTRLIPRVYNLSNSTEFDLQEIPSSNNYFYNVVGSLDQETLRDSISTLLPLSFNSIAVSKAGNYVLTGLLRNESEGTIEWFVQQYSPKGKLLQSEVLNVETGIGDPHYLNYSHQHSALMILSLHREEGWMLTFKSYELWEEKETYLTQK